MLVDRLGGLDRLGPNDMRIAEEVMRYMVEFVDRQHHAREDLVIEALGRRDAGLKGRLRKTSRAHDELRSEGRDLLTAFSDLGERQRAWMGALFERLNVYLADLKQHFDFEERELFVSAEAVLSDAEWLKIKVARGAQGDPLFGEEVEERFRELFEIYVGQVREIGVPVVQSASATGAALVDGAAATVDGAREALASIREGSLRLWQVNLAGASSVMQSRSFLEAFSGLQLWSRNALGEAIGTMRGLHDVASETAWSAFEPIGAAASLQARSFDNSHLADSTAPSWQVRLMNLGLRATVKRMAGRGKLEDIRNPRNSFDKFIPKLGSDLEVETVNLESVTAEIISVKGTDPDRTVLHCPGGGFVMGATQAHRLLAGRMARRLGAKVMLVHYRLAPEHLFPAGLDDCCEAYQWLLDHHTPPASIVVTGDSAGGGLALSTVLRLRDSGSPLPGAIVLMSPVTDLSYSGASRQDNRWVDPSLPNDDRNIIAEIYLGEVPQDHPLASPLFADLSGLPPVLVQVGSIEVLLDDSLRVASKIRSQGGDCECEVWHEMPHDWILFGMLPESRRALRRVVEFVDRVIERVPVLTG